jgi:hypothetical protein
MQTTPKLDRPRLVGFDRIVAAVRGWWTLAAVFRTVASHTLPSTTTGPLCARQTAPARAQMRAVRAAGADDSLERSDVWGSRTALRAHRRDLMPDHEIPASADSDLPAGRTRVVNAVVLRCSVVLILP